MASFIATAAINAVMKELKGSKFYQDIETKLPEVESVLKELEANIDWAKVETVIASLSVFKDPAAAAGTMADLGKVISDIEVLLPEVKAAL